jgi:hypothetical protein
MATPTQCLLALYGALDRAVTDTGDPQIEAVVERYLPGSTGPNAGWYDELLGFLGMTDPSLVDEADVPDLREALDTLQPRDSGINPVEELGIVQRSRLVYAIGALSHLPTYYRPETWDVLFAATLDGVSSGNGHALLDLSRQVFHSRDDWSRFVPSAMHILDEHVALVPQCDAKLKVIRGHLCTVLTTDFTSTDVSLDDLKNVADPLNWDNCLPSFFCEMEKVSPTRGDGWYRVLEHVSTTCAISGTPQMVTALKYWNGPGQGEQLAVPSAWVNYDLDDDPVQGKTGDGRVVVDEGFIRMTSTTANSASTGVHVRTRKVVAFRDLAWIAGTIFACAMGYGSEGVEMLLGGVHKRPVGGSADWRNWDPSTPGTQSGGGQTTPPPPPAGDTTQVAVEVAVGMLNECIEDVSKKSAAIAAKWASGSVPVAESLAFSTELATRLATDPWRYLERLREAVQGGGK